MRRYPIRAMVTAAMLAVALAGCSTDSDEDAPEDSHATPERVPAQPTTVAPPDGVEVSPAGVTTAVSAPAESTENEYFQACYAARQWMQEQGGDGSEHVEPYLGLLQSADAAGPSTFGTPWSELSPGRQAAVIVAVQAAADELCG